MIVIVDKNKGTPSFARGISFMPPIPPSAKIPPNTRSCVGGIFHVWALANPRKSIGRIKSCAYRTLRYGPGKGDRHRERCQAVPVFHGESRLVWGCNADCGQGQREGDVSQGVGCWRECGISRFWFFLLFYGLTNPKHHRQFSKPWLPLQIGTRRKLSRQLLPINL